MELLQELLDVYLEPMVHEHQIAKREEGRGEERVRRLRAMVRAAMAGEGNV